MLHASIMLCPHCGHIFERKTEEERNGVMVEIGTGLPKGMKGEKVSTLSITDLMKLQKIKKITSPMTWRIVRSKGEDSIVKYARLMKYKNGWVERQIRMMDDEIEINTETGEVINMTGFNDFAL